MAFDLFVLLLVLITLGILFHFAHTWYKDREWRKNNPDEYKIDKDE